MKLLLGQGADDGDTTFDLLLEIDIYLRTKREKQVDTGAEFDKAKLIGLFYLVSFGYIESDLAGELAGYLADQDLYTLLMLDHHGVAFVLLR